MLLYQEYGKGVDRALELNIVMGNTVSIADMHMDLLLKVMSGEIGVEDVKNALVVDAIEE